MTLANQESISGDRDSESLRRSTVDACRQVWQIKAPDLDKLGWSAKLRWRFGYFTPDDHYEATLFRLVDKDTDWLDVGCGWRVLPSNPRLADFLAARCRSLTGVDPDASIWRNRWLHRCAQCRLEDFDPDRQFDLISLRMVAEHVANPNALVARLAHLTKPGGRVVIYTPHRWAPISIAAALTPLWVHRIAKRLLHGTAAGDAFPTVYKLNTRKALARVFGSHGFGEESFTLLDDCRTLGAWRITTFAELSLWRALRAIGLRYPETCILGVYRRV